MKRANQDMIVDRGPSVAALVRAFIRRRKLAPGDRLPTHSELGTQLGIGSRRLREGLSVLEHQGVIETRNKGGTIVRRPAVEALAEPVAWCLDAEGCNLEDLIRARAHLEGGAAADAAARRTARDLLEMLDALEQLEIRASARQDDRQQEEAFHMAILKATHNSVLVTFGQLIRAQIWRMGGGVPSPHRRAAYTREHRAVYEAIQRQDSVAARELMYTHIISQLRSK